MITKTEIYPQKTAVFDRLMRVLVNNPSPPNIIILQGGTSSGKTYSVCQVLPLLAAREKCEIGVFASRNGGLVSGVLRDLQNIGNDNAFFYACIDTSQAKSNGLYYGDTGGYVMKFKNGSIIRFSSSGSDSESGRVAQANMGKVKGAGKFDYCYINECNNTSELAFKAILERTKKTLIIDFNADLPFFVHRLYRKNYVLESDIPEEAKVAQLDYIDKKVYWDISTYNDNPYCTKGTIETIEMYKHTDPQRWEVYGLGRTGSLPTNNKFFYTFNPRTQIGSAELSTYNDIVFSFDFNHKNMCILVGQTNRNIVGAVAMSYREKKTDFSDKDFVFVADEVFVPEPPPGMPTLEYALGILQQRYGYWISSGMFVCVGDLSGQSKSHLSADSSWQTVFNKLGGRKQNYIVGSLNSNINYPNANPSHRETFLAMNNTAFALGSRMLVSPKCKNLLNDINIAKIKSDGRGMYTYELYKNSGEHNMNSFDCLRYFLYYNQI